MRPPGARLFAGLLLAVFAALGLLALAFDSRTRFVPAGCALAGTVLCIALLAKKERPAASGPAKGASRALATLLLTAAAGALGGMLAAVPAAYLSYALMFPEDRRWRSAVVASVVASLLLYLLFVLLLQVPLLPSIP